MNKKAYDLLKHSFHPSSLRPHPFFFILFILLNSFSSN